MLHRSYLVCLLYRKLLRPQAANPSFTGFVVQSSGTKRKPSGKYVKLSGINPEVSGQVIQSSGTRRKPSGKHLKLSGMKRKSS
ncbi:hypothetical protein [Fluviicola chungangensis]|uniref:Uncharacterized protein n=1 Tax=Fluviicola chungangensis TaxID=2597671 RepID=A0A556N3L2_9FLAO|nr:hypothetical protein [Fluviicola chungangensis]TSJ46638.1 hypothetical protein FO442_05625 [Fluviicola chungangensis]